MNKREIGTEQETTAAQLRDTLSSLKQKQARELHIRNSHMTDMWAR